MRVIARAYMDEPLDRVVVGEGKRVTYIAAHSAPCSTGNVRSDGVGFPKNCVFKYEPGLFESLSEAWKSQDSERLSLLWQRAELLEP
jgi:hypothetical protein